MRRIIRSGSQIRRKRLLNVRKCKKTLSTSGMWRPCARKRGVRREYGDLVHEAAQATDEKQGKKRNFTRSRKSLFENANSRNAILKRQTADGESRTQGGNRRLRKMNGVGWLQKSALCGKIDAYGASQGYFRCKSGRECHAGERFRVLVAQRMSTVSHAMRPLTSPADDFARHALFYIAR